MVSEIITGVQTALISEFGEGDYEVLTERSDGRSGGRFGSAGEVKPLLFVTSRIPQSGSVRERRFSNVPLLGNRYLRTVGLCVEYVPANVRRQPASGALGDIQLECADVLERLFTCLEYIFVSVGEPLRGYSMQGEYSDKGLSFFVSYDIFVERVEDVPETMGHLHHNRNFAEI
ncbi:MAG: hypothetical protein FWF76_01550 [Oscillospiraceae bacterium]|nr:hypothetical protein [Oscillospiraceae bacterium]